MKRLLTYLSVIFYHRFVVIETTEKAIEKGLVPYMNIYGDAVNDYNCTSIFKDSYGNCYRCAESIGYKQNK